VIPAASDTEQEIPKGSYPAGRRVRLPVGAEQPITVFVNGVPQTEGEDYSIESGMVVFTRQLLKEEVGFGRWLAMFLGLFGTYRVDETIDIEFSREGRRELASDLKILPD
jgi:hypothetical protein